MTPTGTPLALPLASPAGSGDQPISQQCSVGAPEQSCKTGRQRKGRNPLPGFLRLEGEESTQESDLGCLSSASVVGTLHQAAGWAANSAPQTLHRLPALGGGRAAGAHEAKRKRKGLLASLSLCISTGEAVRTSLVNPQCITACFCMLGAILQLSPCLDEAPRAACGCREPASPHRSFLVGSSLPEKKLRFLRRKRGDASLFASQERVMPGW